MHEPGDTGFFYFMLFYSKGEDAVFNDLCRIGGCSSGPVWIIFLLFMLLL